jgi:D-3-phosphoglycerate dehydrogenase
MFFRTRAYLGGFQMPLRVAIGPSSFGAEDDAPLRELARAGLETIPNPFGRRLTEAETIAHLADADALVAGLEPLNRRVLDSAPRLRAIARVGIGMDTVDVAAAEERGIHVSNTPDGPTEAVAEMTVAAILCLLRRLVPADAAMHAGRWEKMLGRGLAECTVLVVGMGRIGSRVAAMLQALGADVVGYDPFLAESPVQGAPLAASLPEALARADVVTVHADGAAPILDAAAFAAVRPGAIVCNAGRGALVDEAALVDALDAGTVAAAWCDAFEQEPYSGPLTRYPQVLLTPHAATYTRGCRRTMEVAAVRNLLRDLNLEETS